MQKLQNNSCKFNYENSHVNNILWYIVDNSVYNEKYRYTDEHEHDTVGVVKECPSLVK